jgi:hypothetical protein
MNTTKVKLCSLQQGAPGWNIRPAMYQAAVPFIQPPVLSFCGEGPRSRRYGRTAAMRPIVQPYNEDEDDDDCFLSFS